MSIHFSQGKLNGQERKEVIEEVQKRMREAAKASIKLILEAFLEAEVTAKLGREKGEPRRVSRQAREIDWACGHCGCRDANQFTKLRALPASGGHRLGAHQCPEACRCWSANAVAMMWSAPSRSWRSTSDFGWTWIKTCCLAVGCARVCAI